MSVLPWWTDTEAQCSGVDTLTNGGESDLLWSQEWGVLVVWSFSCAVSGEGGSFSSSLMTACWAAGWNMPCGCYAVCFSYFYSATKVGSPSIGQAGSPSEAHWFLSVQWQWVPRAHTSPGVESSDSHLRLHTRLHRSPVREFNICGQGHFLSDLCS